MPRFQLKNFDGRFVSNKEPFWANAVGKIASERNIVTAVLIKMGTICPDSWKSGGGPPQSMTLARGTKIIEGREASWTAPALWRFGEDALSALKASAPMSNLDAINGRLTSASTARTKSRRENSPSRGASCTCGQYLGRRRETNSNSLRTTF